MRIINHASEAAGQKWVATVGFFDGVHRGHRFLIRSLRELADRKNLPSAVLTFPVHPRVVLQPGYTPRLLTSFDEKLAQLATTGIDACMPVDFTPLLAAMPARDFITCVLSQQWRVDTLLVGYDHRFGHNRTDGFEQYAEYGRACAMDVVRAGTYRSGEEAVSASRIRQLLSEGDVAEAAQLLTYPYRLKGRVVHGCHKGRELGFATANIEVGDPQKVRPGKGVYAVWVHVGGACYKGMLSIGNRPTFGGKETSVEVHLLHFSRTIYDAQIEVDFVCRLRENSTFDHPDALAAQLAEDRRTADEALTAYSRNPTAAR
ncbi:MAG: riboflavin biosynthesis protein RibF [Tannerella sp.]|nr:riboflavin biosynthesis protein RibF [Tannerella sp.]